MTGPVMPIREMFRTLPGTVFLTGWVILAGCGGQRVPEETVEVTVDTSGSWPSAEIAADAAARSADTILNETDLSLYNERHVLTITGIGRDGWNFDRAFRIQLVNTQGMVIDTLLTKNSFADSLDADFRERAGLYLLEFDFVRAQSLYFKAMVGVDETDNVQPIDLLLTYAGPRKGHIHYWLVPEGESGWD